MYFQIRASSWSLIRRLKQRVSSNPVVWQSMGVRRSFTTTEGHRPTIVHKRSLDILHDPWFNKVPTKSSSIFSLIEFRFFSLFCNLFFSLIFLRNWILGQRITFSTGLAFLFLLKVNIVVQSFFVFSFY